MKNATPRPPAGNISAISWLPDSSTACALNLKGRQKRVTLLCEGLNREFGLRPRAWRAEGSSVVSSSVTRAIRLVSTSKPASFEDTSLATMRSARFDSSFFLALSRRLSVSAANPITTCALFALPTSASISSVCSSSKSSLSPFFFIFWSAALARAIIGHSGGHDDDRGALQIVHDGSVHFSSRLNPNHLERPTEQQARQAP